MNLESNLKELEETANRLESDLPLEEAVRLYEKGVSLVRQCLDDLKQSKGKIDAVRGELDKLLSSDEGD